jgi:hypothetical protein
MSDTVEHDGVVLRRCRASLLIVACVQFGHGST